MVAAWGAVTLNFIIPRLMPGNPAEILVARFQGRLNTQALASLYLLFGLKTHESLVDQYFHYWGQLFRGNLGTSFTYFPSSVGSVIRAALPWTVVLLGVSTVIAFVLGTWLGIFVGWRRGSRWDLLAPCTTFLSSVPYFWLALVIVFIFGVTLKWFPVSGGYSASTQPGFTASFIFSAVYYSLLPAITIVATSVAGWLLGMRNMMITTLSDEYIVMAEAKGLTRRRIMYAYAARNAILPSLASFAMSLGFVVSGAVLVEIVFSYPGIGYQLFQAVSNEDYPLMEGIFLVITLAVLLANLVADVVYLLVDPRTREVA